MGGRPVIGNAMDAGRMRALVAEARPDQVVHLLTALPAGGALRKSQLRPTNDLRVRGTANLIDAAIAVGVRRIVAESFVGIYGTSGLESPVREDTPLPPVPEGALKEAILALRSMEDQLRLAADNSGIETVALRIGFLYGSDVPSTRAIIQQARARRLYVPAGLTGIGPFVHNDDAAAAIVAAVEHPRPSLVYNVADDEPMPMSRFVDALSDAVAAPSPRSMPNWIARIAAPTMAELGSASLRLSNEKVKRELGWSPIYPTVRDGLVEVRAAA
jgi:nucleoside-diphosphate-sugar epimerase